VLFCGPHRILYLIANIADDLLFDLASASSQSYKRLQPQDRTNAVWPNTLAFWTMRGLSLQQTCNPVL
jgi:hypothetical protein